MKKPKNFAKNKDRITLQAEILDNMMAYVNEDGEITSTHQKISLKNPLNVLLKSKITL